MQDLINNLKRRQFEVYSVLKKEEVYPLLKTLIDKDGLISSGGSVTLKELNIIEKLKYDGYNVNDRSECKTKEEVRECLLKSFDSKYYLCSCNAISGNGIIVNIDGTGNRVAAMSYGPENVIMIIGRNKIEVTLDDARLRARNVAAPLNARRLEKNTPCVYSNSCKDCRSDDRICASFLETHYSKPANRIKVILVNEDLGY